ncbi:DNA polymerase III subunit delta [Amedibacterium intestinale]|uniref:DNA polymerase III subunit delta n=1 Tax=Amedibacterium intestinale TaxID=2583452 RepID=UPI0022E327F6|nr:DNA polymerase III subunit delta [Amedibacterium intestinale]
MLMVKDKLKEQQPIVYHTLKNALENSRLAHAYLFSGPGGSMKKDAAILLAQSLLCKGNTFACEECDLCKRVKAHEYADMIYLDGSEISIKKEDIKKLQKSFEKTALEKNGRKIYILDHVENATADALNSLLKFLEEPSGDMTAILLVEQMDRLLPTIVSRCQNVPFKAMNTAQVFEETKKEMDRLDAYFLSKMLRNKEGMKEISESEDYQHALYCFKKTLEEIHISVADSLMFLQLEGFNAKQKKFGKQACEYFFSMLQIFFMDYMRKNTLENENWYNHQIEKMRNKNIDYVRILQILMQGKDKLLRSVNIQLLIDQILYQISEVL